MNMPVRTDVDEDRRRTPRFTCGGYAEINCLPSTGIILLGKIRDLSLHGCRVDTALQIERGARAEIVVRVNAASFRAVGEVRAVRGLSSAGWEFVRLSAGGREMLGGLVTDLARLQTVMNKLKSARREMDAESFRQELEDGKYQAELLGERFPFLRTILPTGSGEPSGPDETSASKDRAAAQALIIAVDLLG
jgi:hypothetical protein